MSGLVKPDLGASKGLEAFPHFAFGEFAERYPCTAAYWGSSAWPDGSPKKPGRVSLGIYGGRLVVQFQVPGLGLMVRAEVPDPILIWDALEALLGAVPVPWQVDPFLLADEPPKGKGRGKKWS